MPYNFHSDGYDSGYESEGGTEYVATKILGKGSFAEAKEFSAKNQPEKKVAILSPKAKVNKDELQAKFNFFKTLYPAKTVDLISTEDTYRLVTPLIPGVPYERLAPITEMERINYFLAAVKVVQDCHDKGLVIVDLKGDNIHFDLTTGTSFLIDGGLSAQMGTAIFPLFFVQKTEEDVNKRRGRFYHYAPENFATTTVPATPMMDVYSLGYMMQCIFDGTSSIQMYALMEACQNADPSKRPTLAMISSTLEAFAAEEQAKAAAAAKAKVAAEAQARVTAEIRAHEIIQNSFIKISEEINSLEANMKPSAHKTMLLEKLRTAARTYKAELEEAIDINLKYDTKFNADKIKKAEHNLVTSNRAAKNYLILQLDYLSQEAINNFSRELINAMMRYSPSVTQYSMFKTPVVKVERPPLEEASPKLSEMKLQ